MFLLKMIESLHDRAYQAVWAIRPRYGSNARTFETGKTLLHVGFFEMWQVFTRILNFP